MCGIAGFLDFQKKSSKNILKVMTDVLYHRGPDDSGYSFYDEKEYQIGLGHRRLSILDLSKHGHQPMYFQNLEIIYNGEIYNFKEIREELKKSNYSFQSNSDTEVILKAYHKWGIKIINKFNGMFAIAIYDKKIKKLILIRDRAGIKPLYWYWDGTVFIFASELKSFHEHPSYKKEIDLNGLSLYMRYGYIPQPFSIFKNTYKLESGYYLEIDLSSRQIQKKKYWDIIDFYQKEKLNISEDEAIEETEKLLRTSLKYRMISDVPVGVFLSGGYDSSIITALLMQDTDQRLNTFTIGFDQEEYDEAPYAKAIAEYLGTHHHEVYIEKEELLNIFPKIPEYYDEPFGDNSAIPTLLVSSVAKKYVGVVLSADGGDELFGGYARYDHIIDDFNRIKNKSRYLKYFFKLLPHQLLLSYQEKSSIRKLSKLMDFAFSNNDFQSFYSVRNSIFSTVFLNELIKGKNIETNIYNESLLSSPFDNMLMLDYKIYLQEDIMHKVDRASMSVSLESREPFLDYRLVEFSAQLEEDMKIRKGEKKYLLKKIAYKHIPKKLLDRPKKGFSVPIEKWLMHELSWMVNQYLNKERIVKQDIFNWHIVEYLLKELRKGNNAVSVKIYYLLIFQMWHERWMEK